jgi:signal transduction histidine kinase
MLTRRAARTVAPGWLPPGLQQIEANARRMVAMLDELLDLAQLRMGRGLALDRRPVDLVALVGAAVAAHQATTEKHRIELRAVPSALVGAWDRNRVARVLDNLLSNAVKYSPEGGEVVVTVARDGSSARLAVIDRGIGIPAAELPRVVERFTRASNAAGVVGTGVGLWSVQHLVAAHGGEVVIESEEGVGTQVTVRLPLEPGGPPVETQAGGAGAAEGAAR